MRLRSSEHGSIRRASGDVDESMLEALKDFVERQKKRLGIDPKKEAAN